VTPDELDASAGPSIGIANAAGAAMTSAAKAAASVRMVRGMVGLLAGLVPGRRSVGETDYARRR
jgi:hypothetical protein